MPGFVAQNANFNYQDYDSSKITQARNSSALTRSAISVKKEESRLNMSVLTEKYKEIQAKNLKTERLKGGAYRFELQTPRKEMIRNKSPIVSYIEPSSPNR